MNKTDQNLKGLEAAYAAVYNRKLAHRVAELIDNYPADKLDTICTELNPGNSVPCFWLVSELAAHYYPGYLEI